MTKQNIKKRKKLMGEDTTCNLSIPSWQPIKIESI